MDGDLQGKETNNNKLPNTQPQESYLPISSISSNSLWWAAAAERQSGRWISAQAYLPVAEEETEVL